MPALDRRRIQRALGRARSSSSTARGRALERLIAYIFSQCPGVRHYANDIINTTRSSEIDVCFWNSRRRNSLDFLPRGLLVAECKNTRGRITSTAIRNFRSKLNDMGLRFGILVAANGVTGDASRLTAAHDAIRTAFQVDRIGILVLTRAELEELEDTDDLIEMLQNKIMLLTLQARTFEA